MLNQDNIVILEERLSAFNQFFVAGLLAVFLFFEVSAIIDIINHFLLDFRFIVYAIVYLIIYFPILALAIRMAMKKKICYDKGMLITTTNFFVYVHKEMQTINAFNYVALNNQGWITITLWYNDNRHLKLAGYAKKKIAVTLAIELAKALEIDVLNKLDMNNPYWIEFKDLDSFTI